MAISDILGTLDDLESWGRNGQKILKQANMYVNWFFNLLRVTQRTLDACITEDLALQQRKVRRVAILVYSAAVFASSPSANN